MWHSLIHLILHQKRLKKKKPKTHRFITFLSSLIHDLLLPPFRTPRRNPKIPNHSSPSHSPLDCNTHFCPTLFPSITEPRISFVPTPSAACKDVVIISFDIHRLRMYLRNSDQNLVLIIFKRHAHI